MNQEELRKFYLDKAKEAEELARVTRDPHARERWLAIARGYWVLVQGRLSRSSPKK